MGISFLLPFFRSLCFSLFIRFYLCLCRSVLVLLSQFLSVVFSLLFPIHSLFALLCLSLPFYVCLYLSLSHYLRLSCSLYLCFSLSLSLPSFHSLSQTVSLSRSLLLSPLLSLFPPPHPLSLPLPSHDRVERLKSL